MRQWNSWGDSQVKMTVNAKASVFIQGLLGKGQPLADASLADVMAKVPASPDRKSTRLNSVTQ